MAKAIKITYLNNNTYDELNYIQDDNKTSNVFCMQKL